MDVKNNVGHINYLGWMEFKIKMIKPKLLEQNSNKEMDNEENLQL